MQGCALRFIVAVSLPASVLRAQQDPTASARHLSFALGSVLISQRDESASPLRYTGVGALLQGEYAARGDRRWLTLRIGGELGTLRSALTGANTLPRQAVWRGWLDVEHARRLTRNGARLRLYFGGVLTAHATITRHSFGDGSETGAALFRVSLSPVATLEGAVGRRGTWSTSLAVPVVALIGRPYGNFYRATGLRTPPNLSWQVLTPTMYRAGDLSVTYTARFGDGRAVVIRHELAIEHYRGAQAFRFAAQGLTLALDVPIAGRP